MNVCGLLVPTACQVPTALDARLCGEAMALALNELSFELEDASSYTSRNSRLYSRRVIIYAQYIPYVPDPQSDPECCLFRGGSYNGIVKQADIFSDS